MNAEGQAARFVLLPGKGGACAIAGQRSRAGAGIFHSC